MSEKSGYAMIVGCEVELGYPWLKRRYKMFKRQDLRFQIFSSRIARVFSKASTALTAQYSLFWNHPTQVLANALKTECNRHTWRRFYLLLQLIWLFNTKNTFYSTIIKGRCSGVVVECCLHCQWPGELDPHWYTSVVNSRLRKAYCPSCKEAYYCIGQVKLRWVEDGYLLVLAEVLAGHIILLVCPSGFC